MDIAFDIFDAYNQVLMLVVGLVFFAVGGGMIVFALWQQFGGVRVTGKIVGIRVAGQAPPQTSEIEPTPTVEKPTRTGLGLKIMILFVPLVFIAVASWCTVNYLTLKATGVATVGTVVDIKVSQGSEGGNTYAPIIEYNDQAGRHHRQTDGISTGWGNKTKIGTPKNIIYDPKRPEHFIIDSFWRNMGIPLVFGGLGGGFLYLMLWAKSRKGRAQIEKRTKYSARETYYPVFEYTTPDGQVLRSESDTGSNMISGMVLGSTKQIGLKKDDYSSVMEPGWFLYIFGLIFGIPGVVVLYMAFTQFRFTIMTPVIVLGLIAFLGMKISAVIKPRDLWKSRASFKAKIKDKRFDKAESGRMLTAQEFNERLVAAIRRTAWAIR